MKKRVFIICSLVGIIVLFFSLFLILGKSNKNENEEKDKKYEDEVDVSAVKDYSFVNVELINIKEDDDSSLDIFEIRDVTIINGYLEGVFVNNSFNSYDFLNIILIIYDQELNKLDEIKFEFVNVLPEDERDLFYSIQKDLSKAYYFNIEI